ncbi:MAG: DUF3795 domain-containing protein [Oscillospiraceae bacterium]|nr:DUF3795 domain-containing protein [Oscillospiraceae bacterium]
MAETYCGKSCAECEKKELMNCPGCKTGPGRSIGGDCNLASCARGKGHETCETCIFKGNCGTLRNRDFAPDQRRRKQEAEEQRRIAVAKRAPFLGKWLWILFWLVIPSTVGSLLANGYTADSLPGMYLTGQMITAVSMGAYGVILLKLGREEESYRKAGIYTLIAGIGTILTSLISGGGEEAPWTLLITIPAAILGLMREYNEYMGNSAVLTGVDEVLSEKWTRLWQWYIGLFFGLFGCILAMAIIPILGALAMLGCAVGMVVMSVLKLVYQYKTAQVFRTFE